MIQKYVETINKNQENSAMEQMMQHVHDNVKMTVRVLDEIIKDVEMAF